VTTVSLSNHFPLCVVRYNAFLAVGHIVLWRHDLIGEGVLGCRVVLPADPIQWWLLQASCDGTACANNHRSTSLSLLFSIAVGATCIEGAIVLLTGVPSVSNLTLVAQSADHGASKGLYCLTAAAIDLYFHVCSWAFRALSQVIVVQMIVFERDWA